MASNAGAPPPAPPPPPALFSAPKVLAPGQRAPAHSHSAVGHAHPKQKGPLERAPFAGVDNEALQRAAQRLRPTVHGESLLRTHTQSPLAEPHRLPPQRHWEDLAFDGWLAQPQAGAEIHAPPAVPAQPAPLHFLHGRGDPLISHHHSPLVNNYSSSPSHQPAYNNNASSTTSYSYTYYTAPPPSPPSNSSNINSYGDSTPIPVQIQRLPDRNGGGAHSSNTVMPMPGQQWNDESAQHIFSKTSSSNVISQHQQSAAGGAERQFALPHQTLLERGDLIVDPQLYIRQYAMQTPASSLEEHAASAHPPPPPPMPKERTTTTTSSNRWPPGGGSGVRPAPSSSSSSSTTTFSAKELRDSTLTDRQRAFNQAQRPLADPDRPLPGALQAVYQQTLNTASTKSSTVGGGGGGGSGADPSNVDALIKDMQWRLRTGINDTCKKCGKQILGDTPGVTALGNAYHVSCFTCDECSKQLAGCSFYSVDGRNLCQVDYMGSLEKCEKCSTPITQKILRAMGKPFHPECFVCPACSKSLDGIPFTLDKESQAFCLDCYHERFSPRCAVCLKAIAPTGNETEVARVIAMDRSYHIDCYRCEDCGLKLNSKVEGQGCYPIEGSLFCRSCNLNRIKNK